MERWREEEVSFRPLNLPLTKTPEFLKKIEAILKCPDFTENLTPPETPKNLEKPKAMSFPISKITIGQWTSKMVYANDLNAKFYFAKKKLMWEILDNAETGTPVTRLKRKIEIQWADVLSFRASYHSHDETGTLEVELRKRPTFFMETNPQARKHTQWTQLDQDFTQDQSASIYRRHTLHFSPGVLQKNLEKLVSADSFWSKLAKVTFPTLPQSLCFDIGYGNGNNNNSNYSSGYGHCQALNHSLLHYHPQGFGAHVPVGEVNFDMETQYCAYNGSPMDSFVQDNRQNETINQLPETQVIQPSSQLINREMHFSGSQFNNPTIPGEHQMRNTWELRGSEAYAQPLLETQTTIGPYLRGVLAQAGETPNTRGLRGTQTWSHMLETQSIPPSFQLINEQYNRGGIFVEPQIDNGLFQGRFQMRNIEEFLGIRAKSPSNSESPQLVSTSKQIHESQLNNLQRSPALSKGKAKMMTTTACNGGIELGNRFAVLERGECSGSATSTLN